MKKLLPALLSLAFLFGCGSINFPSVHKIGIQQGNILDQKMIDQLFIGMTKNQVKYVLGTPIINDTFTGNRWDYAYRYVSPSGRIEQKNLILVFDEIENLGEIINNP